MKKLMYIMAGIVLAVAMTSCEDKGGIKNPNADLKSTISTKGLTEVELSGDVASLAGIDPQLIPPLLGENDRGGNRSCEAVYYWLGQGEDYLCGDKNDYDDGFADNWPSGLVVTVDGIYIGFMVDDCVAIDQWINDELVTTYWKVGAVIVKGSSAANIYYYGPEGILEDHDLFAPGEKPMVSNLTFCFVPCVPEVPEDEFIAIKVVYEGGGFSMSVADDVLGSNPWSGSWCGNLGVNPYFDYTPIDLATQGGTVVGDAVIAEGSVTVTIDDVNVVIENVYIYVGDEPAASSDCPTYTSWMTFPGDEDNTLLCTW